MLSCSQGDATYRKLCGRSYCTDHLDYICVNEIGERLKPNALTDGFKRILEQNNLRIIRLHDRRHTCASLLLANGVPMKQIQEWLGHRDFSTTANIYAHLDYHAKLSSAEVMLAGLGLARPNPENGQGGHISTEPAKRDLFSPGEKEKALQCLICKAFLAES